MFQIYDGEMPFIYYFIHVIFKPYLVMLLACKEIIRDKKISLHILAVVFTAYALSSITILGGVVDYGGHVGRTIGELGNRGPLITVFIIFFVGLLFVQGWLSLNKTIFFVVFSFAVIAMAATRKAFGGAVLISLTLVLSQLEFRFKNILVVALLSVVMYSGYNYAMENTLLGERFEHGTEVGEKYNTTHIETLNFLGDRVNQYLLSWELFLDNKLSGVGLGNFMRETGSPLVLHSEYMVQLSEGGLLGTLLFLFFNLWIGTHIVKYWFCYPRRRPVIWLLAGAYGAVLFINLTAWTYSFPHYFIVFGTIIGYLKCIRYETK